MLQQHLLYCWRKQKKYYFYIQAVDWDFDRAQDAWEKSKMITLQ